MVRVALPILAVLVIAGVALALVDRPRPAAPAGKSPAGTAATSTTRVPTAGAPSTTQPVAQTLDVDVLIYGTQTSGLAALRELEIGSPTSSVALVSDQQGLESPLAQGLCVEDRYPATPIMGFYKEWRDRVIAQYRAEGKAIIAPEGRLSYEPAVAREALEGLMDGAVPRPLILVGQLVSASDKSSPRYALVKTETGSLIQVNAKYFIDASVEADLARMLGADYRIGNTETIYNDAAGRQPAPPSRQNSFDTAPQKMATLLTLKMFSGSVAPLVSAFRSPYYDPASYDPAAMNAEGIAARFARSWTMEIGVLPDAERELNESWNDWPDDQAAFAWVFHPEERKAIYREVLTRSLNLVRYLQEHGYPHLGVAEVPALPYVREGPRVVGLATYTSAEVAGGASDQSIAVGLYARFDRHQNVAPTFSPAPTTVHVPMGAIMAAGHPWLLVSTAISADDGAYCTAVRMEPTRANLGGAAGIMTSLAIRRGVPPGELAYGDVLPELTARGYSVK